MSSELREALTASGASALVPKIIDPLLLEYQRRYSPFIRSVQGIKWDSTTYFFNQRTARVAGGFVTDGGARVVGNSTYVQSSFTMRNMQSVGAITGYAGEVTRNVIGDLRAREVEGAIQNLYWDIETAMCWGNEGSTQYGPYPQFSGLDSLVNTTSGTSQNTIDFNTTLSLAGIDQLIDMVETNAAMSIFDSGWMLLASPTANSKIAQLLTAQQRFNDRVEVAAGLLVPTYRDIPIVKTSFLGPRAYTMGTVTVATATTGGSLPASSTYKYKITAVIARQGEILCSNEVSQATGSGTATSTITVSFSTPTGADGATPIAYKVYRTAAAGAADSETLLGYVDAVVGLSTDGVTPVLTTSIMDDGVTLTPKNGSTVPTTVPAAYVGTNTGMKPATTGQENIYLIPRDPNFLVRPYVRDVQPVDLYPTTASPDTQPFALVSDTCLAIRGPKYLGRLTRVNASL